MTKTIARPYKSPWTYSTRWLAGDENDGNRWAVVNVTHELIVDRYAFERDAKEAARKRQKEKRKACKLGNLKQQAKADQKKALKFISEKQMKKFYSTIPFPA